MIRCIRLLLAAGLVAACAAGLRAAEPPNAKLLGTWTHHRGAYRVRLEIKPDRLHCTIAGPDGITFALDADYVVSKDGVVLGIIRARGAGKKDDEDALQDRLFYFRVTARERTLVVSQLSCGDEDDSPKEVLEGTYARHDGKHAGAVSHADKRPHSRAESKAPSDDPSRRISELLTQSEYIGQIEKEEQPSPTPAPSLTPYRVTGGIEESATNPVT
ncbi:MAG TPA: hypothetical protein VJ739_10730, partial [Gemmataceae bacterium]|nr:hypothetical protein [Gemmataceae bacterium]